MLLTVCEQNRITEQKTGQLVACCRKLRGDGKMSMYVRESKGLRLRIWQNQQRKMPRKTDARSKYQFCKDWITYSAAIHWLATIIDMGTMLLSAWGRVFCIVRLKLFREVKNGCEINSLIFCSYRCYNDPDVCPSTNHWAALWAINIMFKIYLIT